MKNKIAAKAILIILFIVPVALSVALVLQSQESKELKTQTAYMQFRYDSLYKASEMQRFHLCRVNEVIDRALTEGASLEFISQTLIYWRYQPDSSWQSVCEPK